MGAFLDSQRVDLPIVQAGMGGGVSRHELAAAVSEAGGLGTIGFLDADSLRRELAAARRLTDGPIAVNLLLPFARGRHWEAAREADVVVTFWGRPRRRSAGCWIHQCGSVEEMLTARAAGADAVIAQGVEAGGHVRGTIPAIELLERSRRALPPGYPVLGAGGIADAGDLSRVLEAGAEAAVLGTRFLMSDESRAHGTYKERLESARETVLTELFGAGWPAAHRVISNGATERWLRGDPRGPRPIRLVNRLTAPAARRMPEAMQARLAGLQRPGQPILSPQPPVDDGPAGLVEAGPLYAGETVARIENVRPARSLVSELAQI
jgi:NAD(P)H-dependent flavin oxidoreductase YrpB (nitropropane dioxygenase family)